MIKSLQIKNYALIQNLEMRPSPNLNIITGETGAGKSIMLGAVGLLLGNRADTKALFSEEDKCLVEGVFDLSAYKMKALFDELEIEYDTECIIRREISPTGKSRGFINDQPVTLEVMKRLGERLMDIHSQHESLQLGENTYQREILDLYAGTVGILERYQSIYKQYRTSKSSLEKLTSQASEGKKEADYQTFILDELNKAQLSPGEQESLEAELEVLENAEVIKTNLVQLSLLLDDSEFAIVPQLKGALPLLNGIRKFSPSYSDLYERLSSASIELQDVHREISLQTDAVEFDPERIQIVKDRLDLIFRLQQKHGVRTVDELIVLRQNLEDELSGFQNLDGQISAIKKELEALEKEVLKTGKELSDARAKKAPEFSKAIVAIIQKLGIENGQVEIRLTPAQPQPHGIDEIEMLFSANKGVTPRELKFVASGGEFSRLIFAIKYLLADKTALPTIIFDEIDTGVSGEVAIQMVTMMRKMAKNHQVISISHLPQFAAGGDAHYFVYKDHSASRSVSKVRKLTPDERVRAIAQMIGGDNPGESAINSAKELLAR